MVAQQNTAAIAYDKNFDRIAQKIDELNAQEVEIALKKGVLYSQRRRSMSRDGFKIWLTQNGFTGAIAAKYINLAKTFVNFSLECIGKIALSTLFALCQPKYKKLVCKLRGFAWTEAKIQAAMQQERETQKAETEQQPAAPKTGLIGVPSSGRAFQFPLLHDDEAIAKLLQILENRNITPVQLLIEAIALLFEKIPDVSAAKWRQLVRAG
ncbi:MAG TPA: hypothetical protein DEV81_16160 [Cyanobacteria bacterium UBA11049]|nr:hypothetical protein [Cyanobacteria bacterium UBA11049]